MTVPKSVEKKNVVLDDVLTNFLWNRRYHLGATVYLFFTYLSNSVYSNNFVFTAGAVSYRCKDEGFPNGSCSNPHNASQVCSEWIYDNPHSFVAEFDLACQEWKRTLVGTAHSFGYMVGLLLVGPMSDKLGRLPMIVATGVTGGILGVARSFTSWYWMYVGLEFLEAAIGDICSPAFMLTMEMIAKEKRLLFQMIIGFGYPFGSLTLALTAYHFPYFRTLLRIIYTPAILFFFYMFLLDESPRWLLSKGKKEKAIVILEKAAEKNNMKLDKNMLDKLACEEQKSLSLSSLLKDTFSSRALLKRFFVCLVWWTTSTFVNYGLTINSVSLQGNKYVNYSLIALVDIPGNIIVTYLLIHFKRKIPLIFSFAASAILCFSQPFVPTNLPWVSIAVYMAAKLVSSAFFNITYIFTSELFPTYTRNSMHALCSSLGRIGSNIAPQTPLLMAYWSGLPSLVFGGASLFAGLVTFLVPDIADDSLPDTVHQAEKLGTKTDEESKPEKNRRIDSSKL